MKIAYYTAYLGKEFMARYCAGKHFALSGPLKSLGIARALMSVGHEVTIYSPGITTCNVKVPAFSEVETYPEGDLTIKYCNILSKRRCDPINQINMARFLKKEHKREHYDVVVYYNITLGAAMFLKGMHDCARVLEYEDNIFNKALVGDKNSFEWFKRKMYQRIISNTDGVMAVCNGLMLPEISHRVLTPGIVNEEVIDNVSSRVNALDSTKPVHIILTGGIHYSKGGDLLVKAISYLKTPCLVTVYGNCDLNDSMKALISQVPTRHRFEFKGYMPHEELIKTLDRDADILINTTRSMGVGAQAAGFPFKMMEYASTGRPIVSSEIGKLDDDYNRCITYYENENPQDIANAVEEVIANYEQKVQSALRLQKRVLAEYTIQGTGKKLSMFINDILHR
jgi:glycosyltransferase involved in cell wall biosynthesis